MSIFNLFKEPPPPPPPKPTTPTWVKIAIPLVFGIVVGLISIVYNSMAGEIEKKVDNQTLQLMIEKDREAMQRNEDKDKEQSEAIKENQKAIQQLLVAPPSTLRVNPDAVTVKKTEKPTLTPEQFEKYMTMAPDVRAKYKKYLESRGYDIEGLPD